MPRKSKPSAVHFRIIEVMKKFPGGISGGQIRQELEKEGLDPGDQTHLDRRKRELKKWFNINKVSASIMIDGKKRKVTLYKYASDRDEVVDQGQVSLKERAEIIRGAHGRCEMCGRTIEKHGIALVTDHKIPRDWGGTNDRENLWAICEDCNAGKKAYFSSLNIDAEIMKKVTKHASVHVRIGELLKAVGVSNRASSQLIDIVANQDDWQKRLRELRYPVIGWEIDTKIYRTESGMKQCDYVLVTFKNWPDDPSGVIRRFEAERKRNNLKSDPSATKN
jgi:hypothetical protein